MQLPEKCLMCDAPNPYSVLLDELPRPKGSHPQASGCGKYGLKPMGVTRHHIARCGFCGHIAWAINSPSQVPVGV